MSQSIVYSDSLLSSCDYSCVREITFAALSMIVVDHYALNTSCSKFSGVLYWVSYLREHSCCHCFNYTISDNFCGLLKKELER